MKRKRILKWTGLVLLLLISGLSVAVAMRQHMHYNAPFPRIKATKDSRIIAQGRSIVLGAGHCVDCHSTTKNIDSVLRLGQEPELTGGKDFVLPFGTFYTSNLTSDTATGIGRLSDAELARVIRYSVHKNGEAVLPFMSFQNMTDSDLMAVISYLRSLPPVKKEVPQHQYNIMGNVIRAFLFKPASPAPDVPNAIARDTSATYGKHLVMTIANCNECHTKRDGVGNFVGEPLAGGTAFETEGKPTLVSPNLTPDSSSRIFGWSEADFLKRFRAGRAIPYSHMPWESYGRMTDTELKAIYNYLRTLKPVRTDYTKSAS